MIVGTGLGTALPCSGSWCQRTLTCQERLLPRRHGPWRSRDRSRTASQNELVQGQGRKSSPVPGRTKCHPDRPWQYLYTARTVSAEQLEQED